MEKKNPNIYQRALDIVNNRINPDIPQGGGGERTSDHTQLTNRDAANQHPISAITGLQSALDGKQASGDYATSGELDALADIVDGKADAADIPSLEGYATEAYVQNYHDNAKQDAITDLATIRSGAALGATALQSVPNTYALKTDIPTKTSELANDSGYLTQHQSLTGYATEQYVNNHHDSTKQDIISDLSTIRSGASKGATAYQKPTSGIPASDLASGVIPSVPTSLSQLSEDTTHRLVTDSEKSTWNAKQSAISDLATIRSGASKGATAVQPETGKGLFSGNYNDLTNKPTIPAAVTDAHINSLIDAKLNALDGNGVAY